jgi:hypothetical protein
VLSGPVADAAAAEATENFFQKAKLFIHIRGQSTVLRMIFIIRIFKIEKFRG